MITELPTKRVTACLNATITVTIVLAEGCAILTLMYGYVLQLV